MLKQKLYTGWSFRKGTDNPMMSAFIGNADQTKTIPGLQEGRGSMWRLERWQSPRNRMWKSSEKNRKRQP